MKLVNIKPRLFISLAFASIMATPIAANSISYYTPKISAQDTTMSPKANDTGDETFPSRESVIQKYSGITKVSESNLAYLEYDPGLKLKTFGGVEFDVNVAGNDVEYYGTFFSDNEKSTLHSINEDYRTSKILMNSALTLALVDIGHLFFRYGQSLQGKRVSEEPLVGITWFGIGVAAGLEIGGFVKLFQGKRKFNRLINQYNSNRVTQ